MLKIKKKQKQQTQVNSSSRRFNMPIPVFCFADYKTCAAYVWGSAECAQMLIESSEACSKGCLKQSHKI